MAVNPIVLYHVGRTPSFGQFDLDRFTEHYKTDSPADVVIAYSGAVVIVDNDTTTASTMPQKGDAHPNFPFVFVTDRSIQETPERGASVDIVYMGAVLDDGLGNPILPPFKNDSDDAVMSASSKQTSTGLIISQPITVQYYGPTSQTSWFSYGSKGVRGTATDPTDDIRVITVTLGDATFSIGSFDIQQIVDLFFQTLIVDTIRSPEVVAGKYWQNTEKKTKTLSPWIYTLTPGNYIFLSAPGGGYTVGQLCSIFSGGNSATMSVTAVGVGGSVLSYTTVTNSFTTNTPVLYDAGHPGNPAGFANVHVP